MSRLEILKAIFQPMWVRICAPVLAVIGCYDSLVSQLVLAQWAGRYPKVYELVSITSGFLHWWGWALLLAGLLFAATLEYEVRQHHAVASPPLDSSAVTPRFTESTTTEPVPNMTIRELFFHVHPTQFEGASEPANTGQEIIAKVSLGQLRVWGQRIGMSRVRLPLIEIPKEQWQRATFTYWFLGDNADARDMDVRIETRAGMMPLEYANLQVNRAQAEAIWPPSFLIMAASRIACEALETNEPSSESAMEILGRYINAFITRKLELSGKLAPSTVRQRIPEGTLGEAKWMEGTNSLKSQFATRRWRYDDVTVARSDLFNFIAFRRALGELEL